MMNTKRGFPDRIIQHIENGEWKSICYTDQDQVLTIFNALKRTWHKEEYRIIDFKCNLYDDFGRPVYKMKFL